MTDALALSVFWDISEHELRHVERRILLVVWAETLAIDRRSAIFSWPIFRERTSIKPREARRALETLSSSGVISVDWDRFAISILPRSSSRRWGLRRLRGETPGARDPQVELLEPEKPLTAALADVAFDAAEADRGLVNNSGTTSEGDVITSTPGDVITSAGDVNTSTPTDPPKGTRARALALADSPRKSLSQSARESSSPSSSPRKSSSPTFAGVPRGTLEEPLEIRTANVRHVAALWRKALGERNWEAYGRQWEASITRSPDYFERLHGDLARAKAAGRVGNPGGWASRIARDEKQWIGLEEVGR